MLICLRSATLEPVKQAQRKPILHVIKSGPPEVTAYSCNAHTYGGSIAECSGYRATNLSGLEAKTQPCITLSEPFPLLDPGRYVALCPEATFAWARQWKKWIARLVLEPQNYMGRPYTGRLCSFLGLGMDPRKPYAGPQSRFRRLFVEVNGGQPPGANVGMEVFLDVLYEIEVETVKVDREGKPRRPEHWYSIVREIHPSKANSGAVRTVQPINPVPINPSTQTTLTTDQHSNTVNTPLAEVAKKRRQGKGAQDEFG